MRLAIFVMAVLAAAKNSAPEKPKASFDPNGCIISACTCVMQYDNNDIGKCMLEWNKAEARTEALDREVARLRTENRSLVLQLARRQREIR